MILLKGGLFSLLHESTSLVALVKRKWEPIVNHVTPGPYPEDLLCTAENVETGE